MTSWTIGSVSSRLAATLSQGKLIGTTSSGISIVFFVLYVFVLCLVFPVSLDYPLCFLFCMSSSHRTKTYKTKNTMDNPEKLATRGTQDTGRRHTKQKTQWIIQRNWEHETQGEFIAIHSLCNGQDVNSLLSTAYTMDRMWIHCYPQPIQWTGCEFIDIHSLYNGTTYLLCFLFCKGVIRIRISKKNRKHNGQKKKYKRTNNNLQNIHIKLKITGGKLRCSGMVGSSLW
jgi:hypothetical protein